MLGFGRKNPFRPLEKKIGYSFRERSLLETALTHPSCRAENKTAAAGNNQRLEFLGDAALGLAAADYCYSRFADRDEGFLTSIRSLVTRGSTLAEIARTIDLGQYLRLGKGEEQSHGRERESILADCLEAIIGAAYLDGGMRAVGKMFGSLFAPLIHAHHGASHWHDNPKGQLQDLAQRQWQVAPRYRLIREDGPLHDRQFEIEVTCGTHVTGNGTGRTKREAEKNAAQNAIARLG